MKRLVSLALAAVMLMGLAACGQNNTTQSAPSSAAASVASQYKFIISDSIRKCKSMQ